MVSIGVGTRLTDAIGICVYNAVAGIIQTLYPKEPPRASRRVKSVNPALLMDFSLRHMDVSGALNVREAGVVEGMPRLAPRTWSQTLLRGTYQVTLKVL